MPVEKWCAESKRDVIKRDQRERTESPKHERVCKAGERPFPNDFRLAQHLPKEIPNPAADWREFEIGILASLQYPLNYFPETQPEQPDRTDNKSQQDGSQHNHANVHSLGFAVPNS